MNLDAALPSFAPFAAKMQDDNLPQIVIDNFQYYYQLLTTGGEGLIAESAIEPVATVPHIHTLEEYASAGQQALGQVAMIKLNGGLGTSMGLDGPKSLLPVRDGLTFLDIIVRQVLHLRDQAGVPVPLMLMNSFSTDAESQALLARYPELATELPMVMMQHRVPKVCKSDYSPAVCTDDPELEWCPPGHGEVYITLATSGLLDQLLVHGYRYAFISNVDNLGATFDPRILGYIVREEVPFLMEVAARTEADKKGGHLAQYPGGQLVLREVAQCPTEDLADFQNIERHRFFNTNSIWIDLAMLKRLLTQHGNVLKLPMIRNEKTLDPRDPSSPAVYQLETAMGAAISVVPGARALCVDRDRFMPVKTCSDLLGLRSDIYYLDDAVRLKMRPERGQRSLTVTLDPRFYRLIQDYEARFPVGSPGLLGCTRLTVEGDVLFGAGVRCQGEVTIRSTSTAQVTIADQTIIDRILDV